MPSRRSGTIWFTRGTDENADLAQLDFEKLAVGFGAKGFRVNRPDDFGGIDKALAVENSPVIVHIHINGDVELPIRWEAQHLEMTQAGPNADERTLGSPPINLRIDPR
jgi:thiamine pyrophosphate-dependent acetolactate synthase large subunit-like protein